MGFLSKLTRGIRIFGGAHGRLLFLLSPRPPADPADWVQTFLQPLVFANPQAQLRIGGVVLRRFARPLLSARAVFGYALC